MQRMLSSLIHAACLVWACVPMTARAQDHFDSSTNYLTIPSVWLSGVTYNNVVVHLADFSVVSVANSATEPYISNLVTDFIRLSPSSANLAVSWIQPAGVVIKKVMVQGIWSCAAGPVSYTSQLVTPSAGSTSAVSVFPHGADVGCPENESGPTGAAIHLQFTRPGSTSMFTVSKSFSFGALLN